MFSRTSIRAVLGALLLVTPCAVDALAETPSTTLREAAPEGFQIGAAVTPQGVQDEQLGALIARQFNSITAENVMKPISVHPRPGEYTFEDADVLIEFAQQNDIDVVGHTLVWHSQAPGFLFMDEERNPLSREEALKNMKDHIDTVAGHFKGKVVGWDVVNEAISDRPNEYLRSTPALRAIGDDYIAKAFEFAHAADPDAILIYNDYSIEWPEKREKTLRLIRDLKAKGVPIHAVGIQGHWSMEEPDLKTIEEAIQAFSKEGLQVMFTEVDVDVLPRRRPGTADIGATERGGANPYTEGLPADLQQKQAERYAELFRLFRKYPDVVTRVTLWGVHDGMSWLNNFPVRGRTNHPLLWDRDLNAKPALNAVVEVLGENADTNH